VFIQQEKIGERAADIDTGAIPSCIHRSTLILSQQSHVSKHRPSRMIAEKRGSVNATGHSPIRRVFAGETMVYWLQ
jgi:hypothetical protein